MPQPPRITVLGSLNMDISVTVPRLAGPGETVLGSAARLQPGGKGANQAVAAARLGASVRMAGCRGDDDFGRTLRSALQDAGVDVSAVRVLAGVASGLALITVDAGGETRSPSPPGRTAWPGRWRLLGRRRMPGDALILSAEIPVPGLAAALDWARAAHVLTVSILAPAPADASALLAAGVDWLIVNAPEQGDLGRALARPDSAQAAAADLARAARRPGHHPGADGAVLACLGAALAVPGFSVPSVDSVGAGDAFVAALGVAVASGVLLPEAIGSPARSPPRR